MDTRTRKVGKAYVARVFERSEGEKVLVGEGLDARTAAASIKAMEDAGIARHVAAAPRGDLLRFDDRVLPSLGNEVLKSVVAQYNADQLLSMREQISCVRPASGDESPRPR